MSPLNDVQGKTWEMNAGTTGHVVEDSRFFQLNRAWAPLPSFSLMRKVRWNDGLGIIFLPRAFGILVTK